MMILRFAELVNIRASQQGYEEIMLQTIKFLLDRCKYDPSDVLCIMAHASAYFESAMAGCVPADDDETNSIIVLCMFLAMSFVMDEVSPLDMWQKTLLAKYCSLKTCNAAVIQLLELRSYALRVEAGDLSSRISVLQPCS
jgi:hypothetical protein